MEGEAKCNCQRCGQPIAFPVEYQNTEATCPHCGKETTLAVPRIRALATEPAPSGRADKSTSNDFMAIGFILAGIFPIGGVVIGIIQLTRGRGPLGAGTIIASIVSGFIWLAIFSSLD